MFFEDNTKVKGCGTSAYLLGRLCTNEPLERECKYHIVYQLLRGDTVAFHEPKADAQKYVHTKDVRKLSSQRFMMAVPVTKKILKS